MTRLIRTRVAVALAALSLTLSCTTVQPPSGDSSATAERFAHGQLELLNVTTTPAIDSPTFRGIFRNEFDEPVDGIRVVLRILHEKDPTSGEIVRAQETLDAHLEPAEHMAFEITAKVRPTSLANVGMYLHGFAVRRGGEELPISPLWQE